MVENKNIKLKKKVDLVKKANLTKLFGSLKRKMSGQEFKDIVREGWEK